MALNKDILGNDLYQAAGQWNNKTPGELGDPEAARLAFWKEMADVIIKHFKTDGVLKVPGTGLTANGVAVLGNSITGKIE